MESACEEFGLPNIGGNIRQASKLACHATAFGVTSREPLGRGGCKPGDYLFAIGSCGDFTTNYLFACKKGVESLDDEEYRILTRPHPPLNEMQSLYEEDVLSAASDSSDGLLGALWNISSRSECTFELKLRREYLSPKLTSIARYVGTNPWNLFFFWGIGR